MSVDMEVLSTIELREWTDLAVPCQLTWTKGTRKLVPCENPASVRLKIVCKCGHSGPKWICQEHFDCLKQGRIGCGHCGAGNGSLSWVIL